MKFNRNNLNKNSDGFDSPLKNSATQVNHKMITPLKELKKNIELVNKLTKNIKTLSLQKESPLIMTKII